MVTALGRLLGAARAPDQDHTPAQPPPAWHSRPAAEVLDLLATSPDGLSPAEAEARLAQFGPNRLAPPPRPGWWARLLGQFNNLLIYVLLAAALVTAAFGHWLDCAVILGVVLINAVIGVVQEGRAERSLDAIGKLLSPQALIARAGTRLTVAAETLVPGDLVLLQSGDRVPADLRLLRARNLRIDEAALTGESVPADKQTLPVAAEAPLGDRASMAYSGTLVTYGQGTGIVVATGAATEIGRISALLAGVEPLTTPLLCQLAQFGRWLTGATLALAALTFAVGVLVHRFAADEMFLAAVALAVAAIPEGLPAIMTITLAIGVERMARRNAIIRRLPAVETLGAVSVICSDKTGTFTRNEMTVQHLATSRDLIEVTGAGYAPVGEFLLAGQPAAPERQPLLLALARGGLLCSDARLRQAEGGWLVDGDPMEGALEALARKAGLTPELEAKLLPRTDEIPFEAEHRFMATLHHDHAGTGVIYLKGAPETVLARCAWQRGPEGDEPLDRAWWQDHMARLAGQGERLLALAVKPTTAAQQALAFADVADGLCLVGLFGLADPPRPEAIAAVARCRAAGIRVAMITGDHQDTAQAIAARLGLAYPDAVLGGRELDALSAQELGAALAGTDVFARTSPEHKLRLVEALQAGGAIVAMTGDGVNDAPALKRADVGIAMGRRGAEAAKEAAEMVLADDNFASIVAAVEEGRTVYDNLKKSILFILPTSGGEALIVAAAIALGEVLPITAVQILWINMITAVTLSLALAFEPAERDVMARPPRPAAEPLLSRLLVWRIALVSAVLVIGTFGMFHWLQAAGAGLAEARTAAVNTMVLFEVFYLFNVRRLHASGLGDGLLAGARPAWTAIALVLLFQLLFTYAPPMQALFDTRPLDALTWVACALVALAIFLIVELEKRLAAHLARSP
jgi:magnesium-transporting ATPase (P-type)